MGDPPKSPTPNFYSILGILKTASLADIGKAYKSLVMKSPTPNFYSILGIPKTASLADIGKAYKSLVMKWHPDRNPSNKAEAEAKFRSINEAYQVLSLKEKGRSKCRKSKQDKEEKKSDDDEELHISSPTLLSRNTSRISPKPSPRDLSHSTSQGSTTTSMDFYASQPKSPTGASNLSAPTTPMEPIEKKLKCTLKELCHGCVKKKKITRDVISNTGRGDMTLSIDDIKYPGYEKLVPGQGMPKSKKDGDLCLKFLVELSTELSNEQRIEVVSILQECFRALNSLFFKS